MSEMKFVTAAYLVTWAVLLGYALYLYVRGRRLRTQFEGILAQGREP